MTSRYKAHPLKSDSSFNRGRDQKMTKYDYLPIEEDREETETRLYLVRQKESHKGSP